MFYNPDNIIFINTHLIIKIRRKDNFYEKKIEQIMTDKKNIFFKVDELSYKRTIIGLAITFFFIMLLFSIFIIIIALLFTESFDRILYILASILLIFIGTSSLILVINEVYKVREIKNDSIFSKPTLFFKTNEKKIDLRNVAFVVIWDNGIEIAERNEKTSKMYQETMKKLKVPIIRRYKYIKLHLNKKNEKENKLMEDILAYLIEQSNLAQHPRFNSIYLSK